MITERLSLGNHGQTTNALVAQVFQVDPDLKMATHGRPLAPDMACMKQLQFKPNKDRLNLCAGFRSQYLETKCYGNLYSLAALLAVTLFGSAAVMLSPDRYAGKLAAGISAIPVVLTTYMYYVFLTDYNGAGNALLSPEGVAFGQQIPWLELGPYTVQYYVGLDGVSMPLLALTTILTTLAIISAWTPIDERQSQFYGLMLLMEVSLIGIFTALDFFLWFVFWEGVLIPMYFLIGIWGGPRRKYAAIKFFVYTNVASLAMFIGFEAEGFLSRVQTGDWEQLFDGETLEGWTARAPGDVEVKEGEIQMLAEGDNLWLVHEKDFQDFELLVEAKMPDIYNSGIGFRCSGEQGKPKGYQCEIDGKESGMIYAIGSGWVWPKGEQERQQFFQQAGDTFREGEWNVFRIRCRGDHIQVWVNGIQTTDIHHEQFARGYVALQHHGRGGIHRFRNIWGRDL
jgi:hypothetical protein